MQSDRQGHFIRTPAIPQRNILANSREYTEWKANEMAVFGILAFLVLVYGIMKAATRNPYSEMTEEEFETDAKRGSHIGSAIMAAQKIVDANHHVEYVEEQKESIEAVSAESGDRPDQPPHSANPDYKIPG
ncbi:MAG TPA: hypothetical protein VIY69_03900 [Candidatus Acidoferrales bacterium]